MTSTPNNATNNIAAVANITGLGTGVATALADNVGSAGAFVANGGVLGTPSSGTATNLTGTASGLTAGHVTNATLTTALAVNTGTLTLTANSANTSILTIGAGAVSVSGSNTGDQTNITGSAASLSISGQTGLLTFTGLASTNRVKTVRDAADTLLELGGSYTPTGTWTSLTLVTPALGTPASGVATNLTGTASGLTAGHVTNATLTTALTVNTGTLTLTANSANTSVLTIGAGAVSVSGSNTGDQTTVSGNSGTTNALISATTTVNVSSATAPTTGQVLTATGSTAATWQTPASSTPTVSVLAQSCTQSGITSTTSETVLASYTMAANTMGANDILRITTLWSSTGAGTGSGVLRIRFGGSSGTVYGIASGAFNASRDYQSVTYIYANNATNAQKGFTTASSNNNMATPYGASSTLTPSLITSTVDTTSSVVIDFSAQPYATGDTYNLEAYTVELLH